MTHRISPSITRARVWALAVLALASTQIGAKGCSVGVVGDDTCKGAACDAGSGNTDCGGLAGLTCAQGEFCAFATDAQCGAADQMGVCTALPEACAAIFQPVCGCDDKTYGNACEANRVGVSVAHDGECTSGSGSVCGGLLGTQCATGEFCDFAADAQCGAADQQGVCTPIPEACSDIYIPVCGCDDNTYANACAANTKGVSVAHDGECTSVPGSTCGGLTGAACAAGEFCDFPPEAQCGAADQTGVCTPIPSLCTKESMPVCGCDDNTYGNACEANAAGVSVATTGECAPSGGSTCGGLLGIQCAAGEFCDFPADALCGDGDMTGVCQPTPTGCDTVYAPVCGCDGATYGNACEANMRGVSVASTGACP